ncbi:MAG TPA: hypothetical protein VEQ12_11020 [Candidatus Limnocylindria bacterium]|nr:hypothetical protein [Candidatus Limnocylindria bacterium]
MGAFEVVFDDEALRWLGERPSADPLVIAYEDSRCCGGGHIRDQRIPVTVRGLGPFQGLHLDFSGEEWARLLYDTA